MPANVVQPSDLGSSVPPTAAAADEDAGCSARWAATVTCRVPGSSACPRQRRAGRPPPAASMRSRTPTGHPPSRPARCWRQAVFDGADHQPPGRSSTRSPPFRGSRLAGIVERGRTVQPDDRRANCCPISACPSPALAGPAESAAAMGRHEQCRSRGRGRPARSRARLYPARLYRLRVGNLLGRRPRGRLPAGLARCGIPGDGAGLIRSATMPARAPPSARFSPRPGPTPC